MNNKRNKTNQRQTYTHIQMRLSNTQLITYARLKTPINQFATYYDVFFCVFCYMLSITITMYYHLSNYILYICYFTKNVKCSRYGYTVKGRRIKIIVIVISLSLSLSLLTRNLSNFVCFPFIFGRKI